MAYLAVLHFELFELRVEDKWLELNFVFGLLGSWGCWRLANLSLLFLGLNLGFVSFEFNLGLLLLERIRDSRSLDRCIWLRGLLWFNRFSRTHLFTVFCVLLLNIRDADLGHRRCRNLWLHNLVICHVLAWLLDVCGRLLHLNHNRLLFEL